MSFQSVSSLFGLVADLLSEHMLGEQRQRVKKNVAVAEGKWDPRRIEQSEFGYLCIQNNMTNCSYVLKRYTGKPFGEPLWMCQSPQ
ncbi:hypothetical protein ANO11243_032250 [Dothideomycetidae sp. 11243]|nr:hypothetical protein ANO11243_032250 [fungal sp. No.11243]